MPYSLQDIKRLCKGRTPEQQAVIRYFLSVGLLTKTMTDEEYEALIQKRLKKLDLRQRALKKIGLDEAQITELAPVHFENYYYDEKHAYARPGNDNKWRSSAYQVTWIFFSAAQIHFYQYMFNLDEDGCQEVTEEFFYPDITGISISTETVEKHDVPEKISLGGDAVYGRRAVRTIQFKVTAGNTSFVCETEPNPYAKGAMQAMRAKLREKKYQSFKEAYYAIRNQKR